MADLGVAFDLVGWRDRRGRFSKETDELSSSMQSVARDMMDQLKSRAEELSPVGTGEQREEMRFKDAWRIETTQTEKGAELSLANIAPHAIFVIEPTKPHDIEPKHGDFLHFVIDGQDVFTRGPVHHPGTPGNDVPGKLQGAIGDYATSALNKVSAKVVSDLDAIFKS